MAEQWGETGNGKLLNRQGRKGDDTQINTGSNESKL